mgnify:CR=1 FL=1
MRFNIQKLNTKILSKLRINNAWALAITPKSKKILKASDSHWSSTSTTFLRSLGIWEFMVTSNGGNLVAPRKHIERFYKSAETLALECPWNNKELLGFLKEAVKLFRDKTECMVYMFLGEEHSATQNPFLAGSPKLVIVVKPRKVRNDQLCLSGVLAGFAEYMRSDFQAKHYDYRNLVKILRKNPTIEYSEIVYHQNNLLLEGARSVAGIIKGNEILFPNDECGLLPGCTRWIVMNRLDLAAKGLSAKFANISHEMLFDADVLFLAGSDRGVQAVKKLQDCQTLKIIKEFNPESNQAFKDLFALFSDYENSNLGLD